MAEAAARDHGDIDAERGQDRRQHQRNIVADAAGGMLVGHGAIEVGPIEHGAGIAHGAGERHTFAHGHVLEIGGHGKGGSLGLGHAAIGEAGYECGDLGGGKSLAVALLDDDLLGEEDH